MQGTDVNIQFAKPYWSLWYLLTLAFYYILLPRLPEKESRNGYIVIIGTVILALLIGYEETLGTTLSLSRTVVFAPFFFSGYYYESLSYLHETLIRNKYIKMLIIVAGIMSIGVGLQYSTYISEKLLYGSYSYGEAAASIENRFIVMMAAYTWIYCLYILMPKKKIPLITMIGQNTMPIYLCHILVMRLLRKVELFHYSMPVNLLLLFICTVAILILLGNKYVKKLFVKLF